MRRTLTSLVTLLFLFSIVLTACSSSENSSVKDFNNGNTVTLKMYSWRTQDKDGYEKIIAQFEKEHPNIKIDFEPFESTEYNNIVNNALVSGTGPDIIQLRPYDKSIPDNGDLVALDDLKGMENISDEFKNAAKGSDGKIYGMPLSLNNAVIFYNKDLFSNNNIPVPTTWEKLIEASKKLKDKGIVPIAQSGKAAYLLSLLHSVIGPSAYGGNDFVNAILKGKTNFKDQKFVESVKRMKELSKYFPKDFVGITDDDAKALFYTGKAGMYINGDYRLEEFKEENPDLPIGVVPGLALEDGGKPLVTTWVDGSYAIVKASKHQKEAKVFMEYLASKEFGQLFTDTFNRVSAINGVAPKDPIIKEIAEANEANSTPYLLLVNFSQGTPTTKTTFENALQGLYVKKATVDDVIQQTQDATDKWFKPTK